MVNCVRVAEKEDDWKVSDLALRRSLVTLRRVVGQNGNAGMNWEMKNGVLVYREVKCMHRGSFKI